MCQIVLKIVRDFDQSTVVARMFFPNTRKRDPVIRILDSVQLDINVTAWFSVGGLPCTLDYGILR